MTSSRPPLPNDEVLNGYRVLRQIGSGGFSLIYLAEDQETFDQVALKEYFPKRFAARQGARWIQAAGAEHHASFDRGRRLFFQEVKTLATLRHPSIVGVSHCFVANGTAYSVLSYEPGTSLARFIQNRGGGLSVRFMLTVFPALLDALELIHRHRHLHLDIKPSNLRLRPGGRPLLLDFGSAYKLHYGEGSEKAKLVTAGYSPPEQYQSGDDIGPWTDVHAVGATMRTCLDGKAPPPASERLAGPALAPAVQAHEGRYPRWLLEGIDWAMRLRPIDRPQSASELRDYLLAHAPGELPAWGEGEARSFAPEQERADYTEGDQSRGTTDAPQWPTTR
ncbi:MAG: serine/threonine protein kinase [Gammaproteobacteria bacterium]|nr:serine/threonine protein kinase [Gammaproteobacteria bacterium]